MRNLWGAKAWRKGAGINFFDEWNEKRENIGGETTKLSGSGFFATLTPFFESALFKHYENPTIEDSDAVYGGVTCADGDPSTGPSGTSLGW